MPANSITDREICEDSSSAPAQLLPPGIRAGMDVWVRGRRSRLAAIVAHEDCCELHVAADATRTRQILLWPFDTVAGAHVDRRARVVSLRAWMRALAREAATQIDTATPRAIPHDVKIVPYQLGPAIAAAAGASRILLADEVGLGKTIQAGWIVADAVERDAGARVLLAVPASVKRQWVDELSTRFGIAATAVDARRLRTMVADLPVDVSPWTAPGVYVASLDFLKRGDVARSAGGHVWDLLVIDEAHTAAAPTARHAALAGIATHARRVITITATPFSGNAAGFASLTQIGSPSAAAAPPLMFRRSRADVGDPRRRRHGFATVRISAAEARLQRLLERYSRAVWHEAAGDPGGARLAMTILRKRALSSSASAAQSLRRRLDSLASRAHVPRQLALFERDEEAGDDVDAAVLSAPGLADPERERRWLRTLIAAADAAPDSKLAFLQRLLRRVPTESVVVFTEYRDTLVRLAAALPQALQLHGGLGEAERAEVQARFNTVGGLLLATDAAAEGLNLHGRCRVAVNYELPWNPARLEQRIGRVDRIGQTRAVHALTLTAGDTAEDLVIRNMVRRLTRVVAALGREDRLGVFLDEARMAAIVIGGAGPPDASSGRPQNDLIERAPIGSPADESAAAVLQRTASLGSEVVRARRGDVLVAAIRATQLPAGFFVVIACTAETVDGAVAAKRLVVLHAGCRPARPVSHAGARADAEGVLTLAARTRDVDPSVESWFGDVCREHREAMAMAIERETALIGEQSARAPVQSGLFERRAIDADERDTARAARFDREHRRRIAELQRTSALHLTCEPSLVLISWR